VVLLCCNWYNEVAKSVGINNDGHFKSINIKSLTWSDVAFMRAATAKWLLRCAGWRQWRRDGALMSERHGIANRGPEEFQELT